MICSFGQTVRRFSGHVPKRLRPFLLNFYYLILDGISLLRGRRDELTPPKGFWRMFAIRRQSRDRSSQCLPLHEYRSVGVACRKWTAPNRRSRMKRRVYAISSGDTTSEWIPSCTVHGSQPRRRLRTSSLRQESLERADRMLHAITHARFETIAARAMCYGTSPCTPSCSTSVMPSELRRTYQNPSPGRQMAMSVLPSPSKSPGTGTSLYGGYPPPSAR